MGIYRQPNRWQCGPFALKHALLMHGILVPEREISRVAGTTWRGTDEHALARAARHYGCKMSMIRRFDPEKARRELVTYLREDVPCLLCIEEWNHWVTVVREERGQFILLDSEDPAVLVIGSWARIKNLWVYHEPDEYDEETTHTIYDLHPVESRGRRSTRPNFSLERARYLRRKSNREFARLWDVYVEDLLAICRRRTPRSENVITVGEFLRRHQAMIVEQVAFWHGDIEPRGARRVLERLRFVADTYGLVIPTDAEKRAIAALSVILGLWAAAERGVGPVYRAE